MLFMVKNGLFCEYNKEEFNLLPKHFLKAVFEIIDIYDDKITIRIVSQPEFTVYKKDELIGMEAIIAKELFNSNDIKNLFNKGDLIVKLNSLFFNDADKGIKKQLPKHLLKINFKILDIQDEIVTVRVISHPKFKTNKGFMFKLLPYNSHSYSGNSVSYDSNELTGLEFNLSKKLFHIFDIQDFNEWNKGGVF